MHNAAVPDDPRLHTAKARIAEVELAEAEASARRAELDRQRQVREAARAAAVAELRAAEADAEAERLSGELPGAGKELEALGKTMRAAFDVVAETFPKLLAAETRYAELWAKAEPLRHLRPLRAIKRARSLGGIDQTVLQLLDHAIRAQQTVAGRKSAT